MEDYEGLTVPLVVLQSSLRGTEVIKRVHLAAVAVVGEGAVLKSRGKSVTEKCRKCECFGMQYIKIKFGL